MFATQRFSRSTGSHWKTTTVAVAIVAICALFMMSASVYRSHHYLHTAVTHSATASHDFDNIGDWNLVFNVAQKTKTVKEFYSTLNKLGLLSGARRSAADQEDYLQEAATVAKQLAAANTTNATALASQLEAKHMSRASTTTATGTGTSIQRSTGLPRLTAADLLEDFARPINGGPPPMSTALARKYAVNKTIIVTWANYALWDFVKSWAKHVNRLGIMNILVGAMDAQIGKALVDAGIHSFAMYETAQKHSGVGNGHLQWGGESFHKMGRQKINLARMFLGCELNLLLVDVDVVILRNVMHYFDSIPEADILVSSDQLASTIPPGDEGLELPAEAGAPMNIGIMYFRYNNQTLKFVNSWLDVINAKPDYWDQNAFNDMARAGWAPATKVHPNNKRVFLGYNDTLYVGVLPVAMFSGGHTYYIQRLYEVQQVQPYAVHCTFQYGANVGKRNRMREAMIFEDEEEYYTGPSYVLGDIRQLPNMGVAEFGKLNYTQKKAYNVKGLTMQLQSVYPTIGLSILFNRTMIMPHLACYCDRYWTPLDDCRVPGAKQQRLPFECPMDYVLDPIFLTDDASTLNVSWRENSFLDNPRCPDAVKRSKLTIYASTKYKASAEKFIVQDGGMVLLLPSGLTEAQLKETLAPYTKFKVWHFRDPAATFTAFQDPAIQQAYQARIAHLKPVTQPDNM